MFDPGTSASSTFSVSNTIASNNGGKGIFVRPEGHGRASGVLSKVMANNNAKGIVVDGRLAPLSTPNVTVVDSVVSNNGTGLEADTNAILRVAHSVVTGNGIGLSTSGGGILNSYGDNDIDGNTNNNTGVLTVIPTH